MWDDNFWCGCNKCDWMKSFEREITQMCMPVVSIRVPERGHREDKEEDE